MSVGRRIRELRVEAHLTQAQVSQRAGLAVPYLSRLENGRLSPSIRTLKKLSDALALPLTSFFDSEKVLEQGDRCPVTLSGRCLLDHALHLKGPKGKGLHGYSRQQLEVLRQVNYLLVKGDKQLFITLSTMVRALICSLAKDSSSSAGNGGANDGESVIDLEELPGCLAVLEENQAAEQ
jgi:transcriptional regulator with XRE-family HTH domain